MKDKNTKVYGGNLISKMPTATVYNIDSELLFQPPTVLAATGSSISMILAFEILLDFFVIFDFL